MGSGVTRRGLEGTTSANAPLVRARTVRVWRGGSARDHTIQNAAEHADFGSSLLRLYSSDVGIIKDQDYHRCSGIVVLDVPLNLWDAAVSQVRLAHRKGTTVRPGVDASPRLHKCAAAVLKVATPSERSESRPVLPNETLVDKAHGLVVRFLHGRKEAYAEERLT